MALTSSSFFLLTGVIPMFFAIVLISCSFIKYLLLLNISNAGLRKSQAMHIDFKCHFVRENNFVTPFICIDHYVLLVNTVALVLMSAQGCRPAYLDGTHDPQVIERQR
jgi:hypothetical protein